jgi:hypothetical protein
MSVRAPATGDLRTGTIVAMESDARVCPFCGAPPGVGMFCAACGRNLAAVERLPTRAEWEATRPAEAAPEVDPGRLADRCAEAIARFLTAMHAAGDPGAEKLPMTGAPGFRRAGHARGWVLRPVHRDEDDEDFRRYEPGLVVTTEGHVHRLDSEVRGWGQRDFPAFRDTVAPEPIDPPAEARLIDELAAVLRDNGVGA